MLHHAKLYITENSWFLNKLYGKCIAIRLVKKNKKTSKADKVKYSLKIIRHQKVSQKKFIWISNKNMYSTSLKAWVW